MNKKIIGIIFTSFLIVNTIPIVISIEENMMDNYDDNQISYEKPSYDCGCEITISNTENNEYNIHPNLNEQQIKEIETKLSQIRKEIELNEADWTAGYTSILNSSFNGYKIGLGYIPEEINNDDIEDIVYSYNVPQEFDWRNVDGIDWTTSIKSQGSCGSCVAFAVIGALETVVNIEIDKSIKCDLSEAHLFFCGGGGCDSGWYTSDAIGYLKGNGVSDETCFPYKPYDMSCTQKCSNWQSRAVKISKGSFITPSTSNIKNAIILYGPVITSMKVYDDFHSYRGGVYEHVTGDFDGWHCVSIVGYNHTNRYWICKNSWGTNWGENGWFRIKYGQCNIGDYAAYLSDVSGNIPPARPTNPFPSHNSNGHDIDVTLSWNSFDSDNDFISYNIYFGTSSNPPLVSTDQITSSYNPGPLAMATNYYWKIDVKDEHGSVNKGRVWKFSTNRPPYRPSTPSGNTMGKIEVEYNYSSIAIEPDGNQIFYMFDWGDGTYSGWLGPVDSGVQMLSSHNWPNVGTYEVKVKAKDIYDAESEWSSPLSVSMPKGKSFSLICRLLDHNFYYFTFFKKM